MKKTKTKRTNLQKRLTVSLAPGQKEVLERIAEHNNVPLAYVVRYALTEFITTHGDPPAELTLRVPSSLKKK